MREKLMNERRLVEEVAKAGLDAVVACQPNTVFYTSGALVVAQRKTSGSIVSRLIEDRAAFVLLPGGLAPTLVVSEEEAGQARLEAWAADLESYAPYVESPTMKLAEVLRRRGLANGQIGIEMRYVTAHHLEELERLLPGARFVECDAVFSRVRAIKTEGEIVRLKRAANATEEAILHTFRTARVGETEKQLADRMAAQVRRLGAEGTYGLVLAIGENMLHVHNRPGTSELKRGDLMRVDFGGKFDGYASDIVRMAVVGTPTEQQRRMYGVLRNVHRRTIEKMHPGVPARDLFAFCQRAFAEAGIDFALPHIGHGFSLGGHERPEIQPFEEMCLEPNMTICIEPLIKDEKAAYHIEDLVLVTENEPILLSDMTSTEELFMVV